MVLNNWIKTKASVWLIFEIKNTCGHNFGLTLRGHSRLGNYFWDKGLKDFVTLDLGVYHDLLLFNQSILMK